MVVDNLSYKQGGIFSSHHVYRVFGHDVVMDIPLPALILAVIGGIWACRVVASWLIFVAETFMLSGMSLKSFGSKKGRWAIITGPTSGIGEQFAHQLAKAGFNVFLVSRSQAGLDKVAGEIKTKTGVQTRTLAIDLGQAGEQREQGFRKLDEQLKELEVGVLVNNAGLSFDTPAAFAETNFGEMEAIIQVNDIALMRLTHLVVPHLERSNKSTRSKALILNIGSLAGTIPSPLLSTYSASKQFVATFTNCIARELAPRDVVVRLVLPGFVVSKMSKIRRSSVWAPTPAQFVRATLTSIGLARGAQGRPHESTPWWTHALTDYVVGAMGLTNFATWYTGRMQADIRKRALRKKAKTQ